MKKSLLQTCYLLLLLIASYSVFGQDVTINYSTWNPSSPPCNLFGSATNVPATVNGAASTVAHQSTIGQPQYNTTNKFVLLSTQYIASPITTLGTKYRLAYSFKKGYRYIITVTASAVTGTIGFGTGPYLKLGLSSAGGATSACSGPQSINQDLSGTPAPVQISNGASQDYQYPFETYYSNNYSQLDVSAIPATNGGTNGIKITKIVIDESLVPPVFALSPSTLNVVCGQAASQVFTVTNTTSTPNVTSYTWNLGATPNGWRYNGNPAPASVVTSGNTITLTPECSGVQKNITVTVAATGGNYSSNTATFTSSQPTLGMTGLSVFCTGSQQYTIGGLPCGATVNWVSSNTSVATVSSTNNIATLTKVGNGATKLTATITSGCQNTSRFKDIAIGAPATPTITYVKESGSTTSYIFTATTSGPPVGYDWYVDGVRTRTNADGVTYLEIPCGQTKSVKCNQSNSCGTSAFSPTVMVTNICPPSFAIFPNPSDGDIVTVEGVPSTGQTLATNSTVEISVIRLYDQSGNLKKEWKFPKRNSKVQIDVSGIAKGNYFLEIISKGNKLREQLNIR